MLTHTSQKKDQGRVSWVWAQDFLVKTSSIFIYKFHPPPLLTSNYTPLTQNWKDWCWSWSFNTLTTSCKELTHWKRLWCWKRLKAGGGDDRGRDGWMASLTRWTWVWASSGSWWWTGKPGMLQSMGCKQSDRHHCTVLNWTELIDVRKFLLNRRIKITSKQSLF